MENEKRNNTIVVIIMIVIAFLFAVGGWMLGAKYANKEDKQEKPKTEEKNNKVDNTTSDGIEALGRSLFERINFSAYNYPSRYWLIDYGIQPYNKNEFAIYYNEENADEIVIDSIFNSLANYEATYDETACQNSDFYKSITDTIETSCITTKITKENFSKEYYNLFSKKVGTFKETIEYDGRNQTCTLSADEYICYDSQGEHGGSDYSCYVKYEYVNAISTSDNELAVEVKPVAYNCEDEVDPNVYAKEYSTSIIITFRQNENNDWYWYSSISK